MSNKTKFSQKEIFELLIQFDTTIENLKQIIEGEESQAFSFTSEQYGQCIIRINRESFGFKKDKLAWKSFSHALPVPKVLKIDKYENAFFCISELIYGQTVQDLDSPNLENLCEAINKTWETLKKEGETLSGNGPLNLKNEGEHESWNDYLKEILKDERWVKIKDKCGKKFSEELFLKIEKLIQKCPNNISELIHGDFGANNLLSDGTTITGVIDWDSTMRGDSLYDVAIAFYWSSWLPCMEIQSKFWNEKLKNLPNFMERLICYQLHIGTKEIFECIDDKDIKMLNWHTERIEGILMQIL